MKKIISFICIICLLFSFSMTAYAHSGRTDANGGHKDNNNASGLGSYHYHCGGYPAHLHVDGFCPYTDTFPTSVEISITSNSMYIDDVISAESIVSPSNACSSKVSWESSDTNVATVDSSGNISAKTVGIATITASTFNDITASIEISVMEKVIEVSNISISNTVDSIDLGDSLQLSANIEPNDATNKNITWLSSDESIMSINESGYITTLAVGTSTISATASNGISSSFEITVNEPEVIAANASVSDSILPESINIITDKTDDLKVGDTVNLECNIVPDNATDKNIIWTVNDEKLASIDSDGLLTILKAGKVIAKATTTNGISATMEIKVSTTKDSNKNSNTILGIIIIGIVIFLISRRKKKSL